MSEEKPVDKKKRNALSITTMLGVIQDLYVSTLTDESLDTFYACSTTLGWTKTKGDLKCSANLFRRDGVNGEEAEFVDETDGHATHEEAVAALLEKMRVRVEEHVAALNASYDAILTKHRGVLKGARSKIRGKKTE